MKIIMSGITYIYIRSRHYDTTIDQIYIDLYLVCHIKKHFYAIVGKPTSVFTSETFIASEIKAK